MESLSLLRRSHSSVASQTVYIGVVTKVVCKYTNYLVLAKSETMGLQVQVNLRSSGAIKDPARIIFIVSVGAKPRTHNCLFRATEGSEESDREDCDASASLRPPVRPR